MISVQQTLQNPPDLKNVIQGENTLVTKILDLIVDLPLFILPLVFAFAGFMYLTSAGNEEKIARSKSLMLWTLLGFVVYLLAIPIVKLILQLFGVNIEPTKLTL